MRRSLPRRSESIASRDWIRPVTETRRFSMQRHNEDGRSTMSGTLRAVGTAALALALSTTACGKERPALGGRADTAAPAPTATGLPSGELAYVTNEDSQDLSVIDTRTDSLVASIQVGTRPRGVKV